MKSRPIRIVLRGSFPLIAGFALVLASCSTVKERIYTSSLYPYFLDDSTAVVILTDITETEKSLSAPRATGIALRGYRVNYRIKSEINPYMASVDFGDLPIQPEVSPVGDTLFITSDIFRNPFIVVRKTTGAVVSRTRDICCLGRTGPWLQPQTYLSHNDSGSLVVFELPRGTKSRLAPDSIMDIKDVHWHDLRLENGVLEGVFAHGDSLIYMEKGVSSGVASRWPLPKIPDWPIPYGEPLVSFGGNSGYLRITSSRSGGLYYFLPIQSLKSAPESAVWAEEEGRARFNWDVSIKTQGKHNEMLSHVDPAVVTFRQMDDRVTAEYDFSSLIRK